MSVPTHPLLALVDASKNDLKVSLTNYIDLQVEKKFGQLRNRIVRMIEHGEIVMADVNALVLPQVYTTRINSSNQSTSKTLPSESLVNTITTTEPLLIKQECLDSSSTTIPLNVDCIDVKEEYDDDDYEEEGEYMSDYMSEPNVSLASYLAINIITDVIDNSKQSSDNANDLLTNDSDQIRSVQKSMGQKIVQNCENGQCSQPVIEHNQQSMPSTSGLPSSSSAPIPKKIVTEDQPNQAKSDKRKSAPESSEAVKKTKIHLEKIHQEEETKLQVVTLEVNCTEPGCMTILNSNEMWKEHLWTCHRLVPYKHLEDNVRHNQHGQTEYSCTECGTITKSQDSLIKHWRNYHQAGKFQCSVCEFVANFRGEVSNHQQQIHRFRRFQCTHQGCNKAFKGNRDLERHERVHNGERPFACIWDDCQLTFTQLCVATRHVRMQHFHLPQSIREQNELNIIDERDPKLFIRIL